MSDHQRERFDLSQFVLGYLEAQGSIVMPPAFGVYDVLMPDELASRLALDSYQRITFAAPVEKETGGATLQLSVNHPLVETIARELAALPANAHGYINDVRLDKRGLADLARKTFSFPNARVDALPDVREQGALHHYLVCNFKVTFVSEEKQEELATVVMDVEAGHAVRDPALLHRLDVFETEPAFADLALAQPRWPGAGPALSEETLQALLPRAEAALRQGLAGQVAGLVERMQRHLALDLARIEDYYAGLAADLQRRRDRVADDAGRSQSLDDKLVALEAERAAKFQDARTRYPVRADVELVNVLLLTQPKVILPISIGNRTTTLTRTVVWDPLVHRLESLVCDACGEPGEGLHLCAGGHLAHAACLAPQCIDCKRVFCRLCAEQVTSCVVCRRPVCRPSLITCPSCGRGTCREHQQLCHAVDGQPAVLPAAPAPTPAPKPPAAAPVPAQRQSGKPAQNALPIATRRAGTKAKPPSQPAAPIVKGVRIDVQIDTSAPRIDAFVMRSTHGILATRTITMTPNGIHVRCQCEKAVCPADGYYHRPLPAAAIAHRVEALLQRLQQEYLIPAKKMKYYYMEGSQLVREEKRLVLPETWRDPDRLTEATRGFDGLV